ncbi:MAG: type I-E CRISPR-associated endoribonuclease Cas2e [Planctomycetes bacterium]|nr:type I-E CRISPR-associated endoribonuclease Cas2e [Planctomycetota bacterium]
MMVLILDRVKESLRGELTRWMLEPKAGVFVGTLSAMVREHLWKKVITEVDSEAGCIL